jgi:hypothetical protein
MTNKPHFYQAVIGPSPVVMLKNCAARAADEVLGISFATRQ